MKKVVSISLGSSERNHNVKTQILGIDFEIERIGTDGCIKTMKKYIQDLDGRVDALGLGGMDLYLHAGKKRYTIRDAEKVVSCAKLTPIVDGSGLKNTLERETLKYLRDSGYQFEGKRVLMVCALDRFGMAETFEDFESEVMYGDLIFSIGVPIKVYSLERLCKVANILLPVVKNLPFKMLYPTGSKQPKTKPRYDKIFKWADIIAGDFHYIKKHMPEDLAGKMVITNTVTSKDIEMLYKSGVDRLVTTTPEFNGRSFGTNVMEAVLVALAEEFPLDERDYERLLKKVNFKPRIMEFNQYRYRRELSHG